MQTYDGAAVMSGEFNGLQGRICTEYPFAFFTHCATHRLDLVLCQSESAVALVTVFSCFINASKKKKSILHCQEDRHSKSRRDKMVLQVENHQYQLEQLWFNY